MSLRRGVAVEVGDRDVGRPRTRVDVPRRLEAAVVRFAQHDRDARSDQVRGRQVGEAVAVEVGSRESNGRSSTNATLRSGSNPEVVP